jgi:hypothetical protein
MDLEIWFEDWRQFIVPSHKYLQMIWDYHREGITSYYKPVDWTTLHLLQAGI